MWICALRCTSNQFVLTLKFEEIISIWKKQTLKKFLWYCVHTYHQTHWSRRVKEPVLQCVQQRTGESSGRESDGDCDCPTGRSVRSMYPPPPGWDEIWQSPQILQTTKGRGKREKGEREQSKVRIHYLCYKVTWGKNIINQHQGSVVSDR